MAGDAKGQQPTTPTPPSLLGLKSDCKASFVLPWPPFKDASCVHMSLWEWLRPSAPPGTASREEGVLQGSSLLVTEPLNTQPETPPFPNPSPPCCQTLQTQDACQDSLQLSKPASDFHGEAKDYLYPSGAGRGGNGWPLQPICQALSRTPEHIVQARSGSGGGTSRGQW